MELLRQAGIEAHLAENGQQAIEKNSNNTFDGILMDLQMPIMDGYTATKIIRETYPDIPILAMTANAMAGDKEKVLAAGMNDHITKPINVNAMFATIAKWITVGETSLSNYIPPSVETTTQNDVDNVVPSFVHINVDAGLAVANGNVKLYIKLLGKFINGQDGFESTFKQAWQERIEEEATRHVHTLKGSAGNIGAKHLYDVAGKLEKACENLNDENIEILFAEVINVLTLVLDELKLYCLENESTKQAVGQVDFLFNEEIKVQLSQLLELVEDFETDAVEIAEVILDQLKGSNKTATFEKIVQQIEGYEFTEAQESLVQFINDIETST
jgi:polar amino acid transport system substrate-binding protein